MNRTDRLLAIVLELQGKGRQRAEDLAATFETSKRTIYRDIQALCEAGVPVVAIPGQGYTLVEGYFLPPLRFSSDEAIMLLLGCDVMAQCFDAEYRAAAHDAARKIEAVLAPERRAVVQALASGIRFIQTRDSDAAGLLPQLRRAIGQCRVIVFRYAARHGGPDAPARRRVQPLGLAHVRGAWLLVGWDQDRGAMRHFRVDRMDALHVRVETFERPPHFSLQAYMPPDRRSLTVRVLFDVAVARWVREADNFYVEQLAETAAGLLATLRVNHEDEIVQWLLGWGRHARVLEPASLRARLADEAAAMAAQYAAP